MNPKIAKVVVNLPVEGPFDYLIREDFRPRIRIGQRVSVLFNRRRQLGFVVDFSQESAFAKLNPILALLEEEPSLGANALKLTKLIGQYYGCAWGEVIGTYLPPALRKCKDVEIGKQSVCLPAESSESSLLTLVHDISQNQRWAIITEHIQQVLDKNQSVIFLVPEVAMMKNVRERLQNFKDMMGDVGAVKRLTAKKELERWLKIRTGEIRFILGTRSAIFAPAQNLGLIVIYGEENGSYKQEQMPHYHVNKVAEIRSACEHCRVLYVSSAPSVETWRQAEAHQWKKMSLQDEQQADVQIVDMTNYNPRKTSILSFPLQNSMNKTLEARGKVVLFMNRKGFSTMTRCQKCGFILKCPRCDVNLTYMYSTNMMVCRHCQHKAAQPKDCPECHGAYLRSMGMGIERLEEQVVRYYPQARVAHYDKDSSSRNIWNKVDVLIATQAIFREQLNFSADLMAVVNFDAELHRLDFRSAQKAFTLLTHLRQLAKEKLIIQTHMKEHYCIRAVLKNDFEHFYREELKLRKEFGYPPYQHFVAVGLRGAEETVVFDEVHRLFGKMEESRPEAIEVSDPHPDVNPKLRDKFRYTIMVKGKSVDNILIFIKGELKKFRKKKGVIVTVNVDP